jgi:hypothetical protein
VAPCERKKDFHSLFLRHFFPDIGKHTLERVSTVQTTFHFPQSHGKVDEERVTRMHPVERTVPSLRSKKWKVLGVGQTLLGPVASLDHHPGKYGRPHRLTVTTCLKVKGLVVESG